MKNPGLVWNLGCIEMQLATYQLDFTLPRRTDVDVTLRRLPTLLAIGLAMLLSACASQQSQNEAQISNPTSRVRVCAMNVFAFFLNTMLYPR